MISVHPTAIVSPRAELGDNVTVGAFCVVGDNVRIGAGTVLDPYTTFVDFVETGENCRFSQHSVIGGDPQDHAFGGEETWVRIGNEVTVREFVTINRATGEGNCTSVGDHCLIMEGAHLAHNTRIGRNVTITNKVGLAGFAAVDDGAVLGGMAGVHQFVHIGKLCMIGGLSKIVKDVPPFCLVEGNPAVSYGLNVIGLRRAGYSASDRTKARALYESLFFENISFQGAIDRLSGQEESLAPIEREILAFCRDSLHRKTKRGLMHWTRSHSEREHDD